MAVNDRANVIFWTSVSWHQQSWCCNRRTALAGEMVQAIFRRRHQPRTPPLAKIRPGSPAPATGPGVGTGGSAVMMRAKSPGDEYQLWKNAVLPRYDAVSRSPVSSKAQYGPH